MDTTSLAVLGSDGAGKKTLIGQLIFECGLSLEQLEELESELVSQRVGEQEIEENCAYAKIEELFESKGYDLKFHTPSGSITITKLIPDVVPDFVVWVVDAKEDEKNWTQSAKELAVLLSSRDFQFKKKLLILANKMDSVSWDKRVFERISKTFEASVRGKYPLIPISGLTGENLLVSPEGHDWLNGFVSDSRLLDSLMQPLLHQLKWK